MSNNQDELLVLDSFMNINKILEVLQNDDALISAFKNRQNEIANSILEYETIHFVIQKIDVSPKYFKEKIIQRLLTHHINTLEKKVDFENCPVISEIIHTYLDMGLMVQDVVLICGAIVKKIYYIFSKYYPEINIDNLLKLFDYNIYNVLSIYSDMLHQKKDDIEKRDLIIKDNVFLTRTDLDGVITQVTDAYCELTGYSREELMGHTHSMLRSPDTDQAIYKDLWQTILAAKEWHGELKNITKSGKEFVTRTKIIPVFSEDKVTEFMALRTDITANKLASIDTLTGLFNRRSFDTYFDQMYNTKNHYALNMILLDIDDFKDINDEYGHLVGDNVLVRLGEIIQECTRSSDICARWGGEEFVVLVPRLDMQSTVDIAQRIRKSVEKEEFIKDKTITISLGVGQVQNGEEKKDFFNRVDKYLYRAKELGKNMVYDWKVYI